MHDRLPKEEIYQYLFQIANHSVKAAYTTCKYNPLRKMMVLLSGNCLELYQF